MRQLVLAIFLQMNLMVIYVNAVCINVWVHGTYPALTTLSCKWSPVRKMIYVQPGLSLAKQLPCNYYFAKLARQLDESDHDQYCIDHFYTYGWHSSNMRPGRRITEGRLLYERLEELFKSYKNHDKVIVRCIGFSHGGNVILNMLSHLPFVAKNIQLEIVLLATPIQESTRSFINTPYVSKAYSVYSKGDWIQRIDAQRFHHNCPKWASFWSQRTFQDGDKVKQICLKINGKNIGHTKYRYLMQYLPDMFAQIEELFNANKGSNCIYLDYTTP